MKNNKGMALLVVMLLLALMATLAISINQYWYSAFSRTATQQTRIQAKWMLLGGEIFARQRLAENLQSEPVVHLGQAWAQPDQAFRTEDGNIAISFSDAQSCFNINTLNYRFREAETPEATSAADHDKKTAPVFQANITHLVFKALLANLGVNEAESQRIAGSIEARLAPGMLAFSDISELRQLPGISRERFLQLTPLLCALPERKPSMNINTLGQQHLPLLQALFLNQATRDAMQRLLMARPASGWKGINDPAFQQTLQSLHLPPLEAEKLLTTRSRYFYVRLSTDSENGSYRLQSLLRYERQKISVMDRQIKYGGEK